MTGLPPAGREVLEEGRFCYLSATTEHGLHVTPVVFVVDGGEVWATTARGTAKARAWKDDSSAAGLVQEGGKAVSFRGMVATYDAFDTSTWPATIRRAPDLMRATARFTLKNARYFAGYARDVRSLPLSWSPPARVIVSVQLHDGVVFDVGSGTVADKWGRWGNRTSGRTIYRSMRGSDLVARGLFREVRQALGSSGRGVLGLAGSLGPMVLPVAWVRAPSEGAYYAVLPRSFLALAAAGSKAAAALVLDRTSAWRAARMRGVLIQGDAEVFVPGRVRTGRAALLAKIAPAGPLPTDAAVVRIRPQRAVWWKGWASGTVRRR
jgi:nitroimidazol reductase NimA-like FMN-containing flavoprotein (pyridoxamine 5'-phosphate oxidase superfamily)